MTTSPASSAGRRTSFTCWARSAAHSSASDGAARGCDGPRPTSPSLVSHSCSRRTWVDLPAPSPPSNAMNPPPPASRRRAVVSRRSAVTTSATSGPGLPSSICRQASTPTEGERSAAQPDPYRHDGQGDDQRGPDQRLDQGEGATAQRVVDLGAQQREAGQVGD